MIRFSAILLCLFLFCSYCYSSTYTFSPSTFSLSGDCTYVSGAVQLNEPLVFIDKFDSGVASRWSGYDGTGWWEVVSDSKGDTAFHWKGTTSNTSFYSVGTMFMKNYLFTIDMRSETSGQTFSFYFRMELGATSYYRLVVSNVSTSFYRAYNSVDSIIATKTYTHDNSNYYELKGLVNEDSVSVWINSMKLFEISDTYAKNELVSSGGFVGGYAYTALFFDNTYAWVQRTGGFQTPDFLLPASPQKWISATPSDSAGPANIEYYYSTDGGTQWVYLGKTQSIFDLSGADTSGAKIRFKGVMDNNADFSSNPSVSGIVLEYLYDVSPPSQVSDLTASPGYSPGEVELQWTAPSDDVRVDSYLIKYGVSPINNESDFAGANTVPNLTEIPKPSSYGTKELFIVKNLSPGVKYYFSVVSYDLLNKMSGVSNSPSVISQYKQGEVSADIIETAGTVACSDDKGTVASIVLSENALPKKAIVKVTVMNVKGEKPSNETFILPGEGLTETQKEKAKNNLKLYEPNPRALVNILAVSYANREEVIHNLNVPSYITIRYEPITSNNNIFSGYSVFRWDDSSNEWTEIKSHSSKTNELTATIDHLSVFAVFALKKTSPIAKIEPVIITPNGDGINDFMFVFAPDSADISDMEITVYDIDGKTIRYFQKGTITAGRSFWDGKDKNDKLVETGLYILKIKSAKEDLIRSVLVIR